ncbi:MAG: hypothetical protein ACI31C_08535 [Muribaculaceae bacterium]
MKFKLLSFVVLACNSLMGAYAYDFSYNYEGQEIYGYGTSKAESYDVAVFLDNPSLIGAKVTGIRVPLADDGVSAASAWLSTELSLKKVNGRNVNDPNIAQKSGEVIDGVLEVAFDEAYTIPAGGCYVGYSFTVDDLNDANSLPVSVFAGDEPNGFFLHSSRTKLRWGSVVEEVGSVSTLTVMIEGDIPSYSAAFSQFEIVGAADESLEVTLPIVNCGEKSVSSVSYRYTIGDISGTGEAVVDEPLSPHIGARGTARVTMEMPADCGEYAVDIALTGVNGASVDERVSTGELTVYPFVPVNRPLVEEYTGLWCAWCPRGYVALETMKQREGDKFVAVAYHNGDDMAFKGNTPNYPDSYPSAYVNRNTYVNIGKIYTEWDTFRNFLPAGDVIATVEWGDEQHNSVTVNAATRFIEAHQGADYRLSYILIADNLSNERWKQQNAYAPEPGEEPKEYDEMPGEIGKIFTEGPSKVYGLVFNDVALLATDFSGIVGSIPSAIEAGVEYSHSYTFSLEGIDEKLLCQPEYLRVIAVITDNNTGRFVNCNSSDHINGSPFYEDGAMSPIISDEAPVEVARYLIDGSRVANPARGINIIVYSDGSVRKVLVR